MVLYYYQMMSPPQNFGQQDDLMRVGPGFGGYGRPGYGYGYGRPGFGVPFLPLGVGFLGGLATGALLTPGPGYGHGYPYQGGGYGGYGGYGGHPYPFY